MTSPVAGVAAKLQGMLATYVKEHRLPGAVAGVVHDGDLVWTGSTGFADVASRRVADPRTLHRIASITKTFTATAIVALRDDGLLALDDPLVHHLPEVAAASSDAGPIEQVTLRLLLAHQSGFQSEPPGTDWTLGRYEGDPATNLTRATEFGTRVPLLTQEKYSNLGYQLLGEVVARRSGMAYGDFVQARITEPLGMSCTRLGWPTTEQPGERATPYAGRWMSDVLTPVSDELAMSAAEGGMVSCVADLARWLAFWTERDDDDSHVAVLTHASRREMRTARFLADEQWSSAFGLGWYAARKDDVVWVQHGGSLPGYQSLACFEPKQRVGVVVLINGMGRAQPLGMSLAAVAHQAVVEAGPEVAAPKPMPSQYAAFLGLYADPDVFGETVRVEWRDGHLVLRAEDQTIALEPTERGDVFRVEPGYRPSGEPAEFLRGDDGRVRRLWIGGGSYRRLDPVD
jgi:CubicO group peptidase (beta-lactamase class C family)